MTTLPPTRVADPRAYGPAPLEQAGLGPEWLEAVRGPGKPINLTTGQRLWEIRDTYDKSAPAEGVQLKEGEAPAIADIPNPDAPDGRWSPTAFMPRFVFEEGEDAFPVDPAFDGDDWLSTNAPEVANGEALAYEDGKVGGRQKLSGGFVVSRKGDYTVLSYPFYYAHNKAGDYHRNDYSIAQVYLKPGPDGKLAPTHLYTSWHHGGTLTPWNELEKDAQGRPVIKVQRGSHALQPVGVGQDWPKDTFQIRGDGRAEQNGKPLSHRMTFETFQGNVKGARRLDPQDPLAGPRLTTIGWGTVATDPLPPEAFDQSKPWSELAERAWDGVKTAWEKVKGTFSMG